MASQLVEAPNSDKVRDYGMLVGGESKTIWIELSGKTRDPFALG